MRARDSLVGLTGLLLIAVASAGFLARALLAAPEYGRRPRLAAVIDGGKMEEFIETASQKEVILSWVAGGAPQEDWPNVHSVLEARCASCHHTDASFEMLPLDNYDDARSAAAVLPKLREKITGGTMGEYLETVEAQTTLVAWIDAGARESEWPEAKAVLDAHCIHCHNPEGVQGIVTLQTYRSVSSFASVPPAVPRPIAVPGLALLASVLGLGGLAYSRRRGQS